MTKDNAIFRVLIDQYKKDENGIRIEEIATKKFNGVERELRGGVILDKLGEKLGYIYNHDKYDADYNRKPENYVFDWYNSK